ncbi:MAG: serine/threonine protein kinase [Planctomycetes bacterium]|nr:serine/threonine protein kinase [Planctomycetota bacterium]
MDSAPNADAIMAQCKAAGGPSLAELLGRYPGHEENVARIWFAAHAVEPAPAALRSADHLGPYERLHPIGSGAQGEVFLARDVRLRRTVVLKVLSGTPTQHAIERLRHEAAALARLRHPGIAELLDADFDAPSPYLVLRHVDGLMLSDARSATTCPVSLFASPDEPVPPRSLRWFEQLARTVHAAHEAGVVHADLHPGNLMVATHGAPVVLDFGTAKVEGLARITLTGLALGSARFAAPEVLRGRRADRRSDVFSLGAVIVDCLGPTPKAADMQAALAGIANQALRAVLQKAVAADAADRFATALELAEELHRLRRGVPVRTGRPGPFARALRFAVRNRVALAAALVLTALLLAALQTYFDTLRAHRQSDAASERGRALIAGLAVELGAQHVTDIATGEGAGGDLAGDGELAAGIELEVGRILRRAGRFDAAQGHIDAGAHTGTPLADASFDQAMLAFDRGAPITPLEGAAAPVRDFVAGLRALQLGQVDDAMWSLQSAVRRDDWPEPSLRAEARVLSVWLALDEGHATAGTLLADLTSIGPSVFDSLARLLRARASLGQPGCDVGEALTMLRRARADLARSLGDGHVWVLRAERAVAIALAANGEPMFAERVCEGLAPRQLELHGAAHPEVVRTRLLQWRCKRQVSGAAAAAALAEVLEATPRTAANRHLFDELLDAEAQDGRPLEQPSAARHLDALAAAFRRAEDRTHELYRQFEEMAPADRGAFMRDLVAPHRFGVEFPAHTALDRAREGEAGKQHLEVLLGGIVEMATGHWEQEALRVARYAMAIVLHHRGEVDPTLARLIECWFIRLTAEERGRRAGGIAVIAESQDLVMVMRMAVVDLRILCRADDERLQSAMKAFADMLGNQGGPADAAEALELYEALRGLHPDDAAHTIWCAEAAFSAGDAERLSSYLVRTEQLLGERPPDPNYLWLRLDELRLGLGQLRSPAKGR